MTPNERSILEFAERWHRFDGGDEYILPTFGITPAVFYQRVLRLLIVGNSNGMDMPTCELLRQLCYRKLALLRPERTPINGALKLPASPPECA
ncbi:DUF3263 domain-containing protein [Nocardia barduliensis]|uniref:DUF3263 domain-containing protein n=1 Tax=Nocardia barduliensis TaxID=2736643 RepID=UPI001574B0E5|nr:DUF3263 domain-containing protein [Nocardia barduliensis]